MNSGKRFITFIMLSIIISLARCCLDFKRLIRPHENSSKNKKSKENKENTGKKGSNWYTGYFKEIADEIKMDYEAQKYLKMLQYEFLKKFQEKITNITSLKKNTGSGEDIEVSAFSSLIGDEAQTGAFGDNNSFDTNEKKAIICGARGKIVNLNGVEEIKMVTVGEIVDFNIGALIVGYTSFKQDGTFDLNIKINDNYRTSNFNSKSEFITSKIVSRKVVLNKLKMSIGTSNIYLLTIGKDFVKFTIYNLLVGASLKKNKANSRSLVNIRVFTVDENLKVESVEAVFISSNLCEFTKECVSTHDGYMKVYADKMRSQQHTKAAAISSIKKNMNASVANYHACIKKKK
jgi:hypothetical protein